VRRFDVIQRVVNLVPAGTPVIANTGDPCKELYCARDRQANFYMLGSLGLASSIALGLAIGLRGRRKVVALDGDGAVLMNMGALTTLARYGRGNVIEVILDNSCYGSTGGQPTATSCACDLAEVARACGIRVVHESRDMASFEKSFLQAVTGNEDTVIVAYVSPETIECDNVALDGPEIRCRFMAALA